MKALDKLKQLVDEYKTHRIEEKACLKAIFLDQLSCEAINVMEFDGRLYISHNGVPIVRVDDLKVKAPELLAQARRDYLAWKSKFDNR